MNRIILTIATLFLSAAYALCDVTAKQAFDELKKLEGTWEGKASHGKGDATPVKVIYKLTGGGSALVETLFPGTPHEMITVYHLDGERLLLTHYCAAQNQPTMKLVLGKDLKTLKFDFVSGTNMKPDDVHMRNVTYHLISADQIVSEWSHFAGGKAAGTAKFELKRVKA